MDCLHNLLNNKKIMGGVQTGPRIWNYTELSVCSLFLHTIMRVHILLRAVQWIQIQKQQTLFSLCGLACGGKQELIVF